MTSVARVRIDEEVKRHKLAILALLSQKNALSPIFRLPVEVLIAIFIRCVQDDYVHDYHGVPPWVNISYVCRHWRNVTLNCPTLWSYLFMVSVRWMDELLARSKPAPLKLSASLGRDEMGKLSLVKRSLNQIERIQELHISGLPVSVFPELHSRAPCLQNLTIRSNIEDRGCSSVLFDGDTPLLRTLELSNCPVPWYLFKLRSLTTFILNGVPTRFQLNLVEFQATLRCMSGLVHLDLDLQYDLVGATEFLSGKIFHAFQKINLSRLSRIWIVAPLPTFTALLSCTYIPSSAEVRLRCLADQRPRGKRPILTSILRQGLNEVGNHTAPDSIGRSLFACFGKHQDRRDAQTTLNVGVSEDVWVPPTCTDARDSPWDGNPPFRTPMRTDDGDSLRDGNLLFHIDFHLNDIDKLILYDVCSTISLTSLQTLYVVNPPTSHYFWRQALDHFPNLRRLVWHSTDLCTSYSNLASFLLLVLQGHSTEEDGRQSSGVVPLSALEELELQYLRMTETQLQSIYGALASRKPSRGKLTVRELNLDRRVPLRSVEIVGRWEDGRFLIAKDNRPRVRVAGDQPETSCNIM